MSDCNTKPRNPDWECDMRSLERDWNSYGGAPITEAAIQAMKRLLAGAPQVVPLNNGGLQLDWDDAELAIGPNGEQDFGEE